MADRLDELMGKGSLPAIKKHHEVAGEKARAKNRNSKETQLHSLNKQRAHRLQIIASKNPKSNIYNKDVLKQYAKEDSVKARKLRSEEVEIQEDLARNGKKKLSTFDRLQRKTKNFLKNRDNNIVSHHLQGKTPGQIAAELKVHPAIVGAVIGAETSRAKTRREETNLTSTHKVGDIVRPTVGPHKGQRHSIIHDFGDGHYNIRPMDIRRPRDIKYHLGAARAHTEQLIKEGNETGFAKLAKKITNKSLNQWLKARQTTSFGGIQDKAKGIKNNGTN